MILVESIQRPRWFRCLERLKGLIFRKGTYGLMQVKSPSPIGDRASIDRALRIHRAAFTRVTGNPRAVDAASVVAQLRSYNGSLEFREVAQDVYREVR